MTRLLSIALGALILLGGGAYFLGQSGGSVPGISVAEAQDATTDVELAPDYALGDENAPVTIYEYASFTCPHCAHFDQDQLAKLKTEYIDTGKVRFIQREVYFDRFGLWAGMLARCGGEMRYYGISDMLFAQQKEWIGSGEANEIIANLKKIGRVAGMSDDDIDACLNDEDLARSMVAAYQTHAAEDDVNATPTLIINGEKHSNMAYEDLKKIIDGLLPQDG